MVELITRKSENFESTLFVALIHFLIDWQMLCCVLISACNVYDYYSSGVAYNLSNCGLFFNIFHQVLDFELKEIWLVLF